MERAVFRASSLNSDLLLHIFTEASPLLRQLCANWLAIGCNAPTDCGRADLIDDGTVDLKDFAELSNYWMWP